MATRGSILIMVFMILVTLVSLVGGFLYAAGVFIVNSGWEETDAQAFWLAEAGLQRAIWNLKTPVAGGGQGETWTTAGVTQPLGAGTYTIVVARWDFALAANGATAAATSSNGANVPGRAIDGDAATFWESADVPDTGIGGHAPPQSIIITFPYTMRLNKVRFLTPAAANRPRNYTWDVSSDNVAYTTVVTVNNNSATDVTDTFVAQTNVSYLRLQVTRAGSGGGSLV